MKPANPTGYRPCNCAAKPFLTLLKQDKIEHETSCPAYVQPLTNSEIRQLRALLAQANSAAMACHVSNRTHPINQA